MSRQYWQRVKEYAKDLRGDGCTASPDFFYRKCCDEHDIAYRTGKTVDGAWISRKEADYQMFKCMQQTGKTPILGTLIIPGLYWVAVRLLGAKAWKNNKALGE